MIRSMARSVVCRRGGGVSVALAVGLALLGGCDLEFPEQEVILRHDADRDTLDILCIVQGLTTPDDTGVALEKGVAAVRRLLGGSRELMLLDWPFYWNLDDIDAEQRSELTDLERSVIDGFRVSDAGLFRDDEGRLSGYQVVHLDGALRLMRLINESLRAVVLENLARGRLERETPDLDDRTRARLVAEARERRDWVRWRDGGLAVDVPISRASQQRLVHTAVQETSSDEIWVLANLLAQVRRFSGEGERIDALLGGGDDGRCTLRLRRSKVRYAPALAERLEKDGLLPEHPPTLADVRALLD